MLTGGGVEGSEETRDLVVRAASPGGDAADRLTAFGELVTRFQDMVYGYAYSILGHFHLAEDAAQDAFITAFLRLEDLREPGAFAGWLRRIVHTACGRLTRRKEIPTAPLDAAAEPASRADEPARVVERSETRDQVLGAIRQLPDPQREATTLFYINGYSQSDIADFLEVPVSTVKNRLAASRSRLKERMLKMVEETLRSHRPGPEQRKAIIDELMGRKTRFDQTISASWEPSTKWADWWHQRRMEDVRANAASYGVEPDESLPRMLPEYQASNTFRDDFKDLPRRWRIPEGTRHTSMRDLCRDVGATPLAVYRWAAEGLPVLRYFPWLAYDESKAREWIASRGVHPDEQMTPTEAREPLLLTLRALAAGEASLAEAKGVVSALGTSVIKLIAGVSDLRDLASHGLDPLWTEVWQAQQPREKIENASRYGLSEPSEDWLGIPAEVGRGRVFEIRDLCRRLEVSPFDVVRWTREGMPCLRCSPWVRWDVEHVAEWVAQRGSLPGDRHTAKELDSLDEFLLAAVANGDGSPDDAREILSGWLAMM